MKTVLIETAVLIGALALSISAQEPNPLPPTLQNVTDLTADFALVQREPDGLYGLGRDYTVRFHRDRVEYLPHLPTAPTEQPLVLRTTRVGRGDARFPAAEAANAEERGLTVRYARGPMSEVYEVRPGGLKQSFVFDALPAGAGDLVVEVDVASTLPFAGTDADAVEFRSEHGAVRIDGVVGVDARGTTAPGSLSYADGVMSLRLPADFVARAVLPLELDPIVSTTTLTSSNVNTQAISAAYDATYAAYLVVWGANVSGSSTELRGYFVPGGPVLIEPAAVNNFVSVANNNASNCFVVTWNVPRPNPLYAIPPQVLRVRVLRPNSPGTSIDIPGQGSAASNVRAYVASNPSTSDNRMLMAYEFAAASFPAIRTARLRTMTVLSDLSITGSTATDLATPAGLSGTHVSISRTADGSGQYLVAFAEQIAQYDHQISFVVYDVARTSLSNVVTMAISGANKIGHISIDGAAPLWIVNGARMNVGYDPDIGGIPQIYRLEYDSARRVLLATLGISLLNSATSQDIAVTPRMVVVCWDYWLAHLTRQQCVSCSQEWTNNFYPARPTFARPAANGASGAAAAEQVKMFWGLPSGPNSIYMGDYAPADGIVTDLGGGCGTFTSRVSWSCARVGGTHFESVLEDAPREAYLILSLERIDASGCGSCTLVPNPWNALIFDPRSGSSRGPRIHSVTIPNDPLLIGLRLYQQWLVGDPAANGCPSLSFNLSNALQIEIQ